jgi:hypothetical protein
MLRMNSKATILIHKKVDGRLNKGVIVGIEMTEDRAYLGYLTPSEFFSRFTRPRYKVAYIDCVTNRACTDWFQEDELQRTTK